MHALVAATPRLNLDRLQEQLASEGITVCRDTTWRFLRCRGLRNKNAVRHRADKGDGGSQAGAVAGAAAPAGFGPAGIRGRDLDQRPTWRRSGAGTPKEHRLKRLAPYSRSRTLTFLAGLRRDGPTNQRSFRAWVEQHLSLPLRSGDLVSVDNLASHKGRAVCRAPRNMGARVWFLPSSSPALNPVRQAFVKMPCLADERSAP